jgi:hypothetical protein
VRVSDDDNELAGGDVVTVMLHHQGSAAIRPSVKWDVVDRGAWCLCIDVCCPEGVEGGREKVSIVRFEYDAGQQYWYEHVQHGTSAPAHMAMLG